MPGSEISTTLEVVAIIKLPSRYSRLITDKKIVDFTGLKQLSKFYYRV